MLTSAQELLDIVQHLQLLTAGQLDDLAASRHRISTAKALADQFVQRAWLTEFQAKTLLEGQGASLRLGAYRLLDVLGEGGMGQVFKACHVRLNRVVALKTIHPRLRVEQPEIVRRFEREAQAVAQLLHPNIVILFDADEIDGIHFIAMEYVDGIDLARVVKQQGPLPVPMACDYIRQAALGLQHAHERELVHRDIKPSNLLVTRPSLPASKSSVAARRPSLGAPMTKPTPAKAAKGGVIKILDMGLVRLADPGEHQDTMTAITRQGAVIGTPDFIAPEQARDASRVDIRADIYSLGCTLYFLLTGRLPFPDGTTVEKLMRHQHEQPTPVEKIRPQVPPEVAAIVTKMMHKAPESRYQSPDEVVDAINRMIAARRGVAQPARPVDNGPAAPAAQPPSVPDMATVNLPPDAVTLAAQRLGTLSGHSGLVAALAFNSNGRYLVSGGIDGTVRLWDVADPRLLQVKQLSGKLGEVAAVAFSPTDQFIVTGSTGGDGRMWLWDWKQSGAQERAAFPGDAYLVSALTFSPDGKTLAGCSGGVVLAWGMGAGADLKRPTTMKGHTGTVAALAFAPDSQTLASGGDDTQVRTWEPGRMWSRERAVFAGHTDAVAAIAYAPDGSVLASAGKDRTVALWDATGETTERVAVLEGHAGTVRGLHFTPSGDLLLSVTEAGQVFVWDMGTLARACEWQLELSLIRCAAFSPEGKRLAVGGADGKVGLFDLDALVERARAAGGSRV